MALTFPLLVHAHKVLLNFQEFAGFFSGQVPHHLFWV
jgi:hypothetical protein